jgi:hypothetical protein
MAWRVARSLDILLGQLNALAPRRSKASDGSIGDAAHATRDSDHNPWYVFGGQALVTARDFTHDPAGGLDCHQLAAALVGRRDPRIKYVIWNRRILSGNPGPSPWRWRAYSGSNPHTKHLHVSVVASPACDSPTSWAGISPAPPLPKDNDVELADKIRFWDGFEITVGQALADTWQLANNLSNRPTRPKEPADPAPWIGQVLGQLAAMRADVAACRGELAGQGELLRQIAQDEELDLDAIQERARLGARQGVAESTIDVDINVGGPITGVQEGGVS